MPAVIDFHQHLTGPKGLLIQVGDHGNAELPGLLGLPAKPTDMTYRWMDHHLGGSAGDGRPPKFDVRSEHMHDLFSDLRHPTWADYALPTKRLHLTDAPTGQNDGQLVPDGPQAGWTRSVKATGTGTGIVVAPQLIQTGLAERLGRPHTYTPADIDRGLAAFFATAPLEKASRVRGDLELRVTVSAQQVGATIVAYLLDADPATGRAQIITNAPYTFTGDRTGKATTVTFPLQPADYIVARGHQLQLVIDTHDPFFAPDITTTPAFTIDLTSPAGTESYLDIPLHPID
ncbi:CocE/NonD family hydrolase C-terminal non-catalytic domain-containing protein [Streptomyces sp. NPDC127069]|uniref:CocE/NonD family hydrolase C-terminal non-catalytic domain-containing protein n=1 Tax=Streptomyces sp. NPDC127069 TaxID=3347128 RepID=UPI0036556A0E